MLVASQYSQIKNNKPKNKQNQATQQQGAQQAKLRSSIGNDIVQGIKKTFSGK